MDPLLGRLLAAGLAAALSLGLDVETRAQDTDPSSRPANVRPSPAQAPPPIIDAPLPAPDAPPSPPSPAAKADDAVSSAISAAPPRPKVVAPVGPPTPERAPSAVLRVLDKVTAETMAFEAPIGRRVRYKSLVFEVKACETRGLDDPQPQPSAYLVITSDAGASGAGVLGVRPVFKGWMFANAPSLHAVTHPVYDAWLIACSTAAPAQ